MLGCDLENYAVVVGAALIGRAIEVTRGIEDHGSAWSPAVDSVVIEGVQNCFRPILMASLGRRPKHSTRSMGNQGRAK
jgi:hypothetical protein